MLFSNLDTIVRRNLLEKGMSIHYYFEFLLHACTCLRELTFDTLKIVNTLELPVGSYMQVDLPDDFVDDVMLAIPVGGLLQPISKKESITPLRTITPSGQYTTPIGSTNVDGQFVFGINTNWLFYWNINDYGEPTGRYFGANAGAKLNGYKIIRERRQIQLTGTFTSPTIVLIYISDGQRSDSASLIDNYAFSTIQAFINWKRSPNAEADNSPEGRHYYNQRRLLVARMNDLTVEDVINIVRSNYHASIKN